MKILNLYCGIGGNRKNWDELGDFEIIAIEHKPEIAKIYQDFFPNDKVIVTDAHQYLLDHYKEFDFIWSSPPCPTHSRARYAMANSENQEFKDKYNQNPVFPSMILYEEILFLEHYFKGRYCVENVIAFYPPLIPPHQFGGHWFWTNFLLRDFITTESREHGATVKRLEERKQFDLSKYKMKDKGLALRNCVEPELAKHILDLAINPIEINKKLF